MSRLDASESAAHLKVMETADRRDGAAPCAGLRFGFRSARETAFTLKSVHRGMT